VQFFERDASPLCQGVLLGQRSVEFLLAKLVVIVIEIRLQGDVAYDYGWHDLTLTPKDGGGPIHRRDRYVDIWRKNKDGKWKLWMYMDNQDIADPFRESELSRAAY
jgi:ketosteroid isomerase-like protein